MLLLGSALGVPTCADPPCAPQQQAMAIPQHPSIQATGYLCMSTAVDIKTASCNVRCNAAVDKCPEACLCMRADTTTLAPSGLSYEMPSEDFLKLSGMLEPQHERVNAAVAFEREHAPDASIAARSDAKPPARLPQDMAGYYMKTWNLDSCKTADARICAGPDKKNINVAFSGVATLDKALNVTLKQQQKALEQTDGTCANPDKRFCNQQIHNKMPWEAKTREEAIAQIIAPGAWTEKQCKDCFNDEMNITIPKKPELPVAKRLHPFSREAGLHKGLQFLSLGGATDEGSFNVARLAGFFNGGLEPVKAAGFDGM